MKIFLYTSILIILVSCSKNEFDQTLIKNNIPLTFKSYFDKKSFSLEPFILIGENKKNNELIKIQLKKTSSTNDTNDEVKKFIFLIASQYEFSIAPYPGQITSASNCGNKHSPKLYDLEQFSILETHANERMALSICNSDENYYYQYSTFYSDKNNSNLIIVEYYTHQQLENPQLFFKKYFLDFKSISLTPFKSMIVK